MREEESSPANHLFESDIVGFAITDEHGNLASCNYPFLKMLGYTKEDWLARTIRWDKINPPDYHQLDEWIIEEVKATGKSSSWEKEFIHKEGKRVSALVTVAPLDESAGRFIYFVLGYTGMDQIMQTLREEQSVFRLLAEARLQESEEKFRQLAESINDVFWLATPNLASLLYVSPAFEKAWGLSSQLVYENPLSILESIHSEDRESVKSLIAELHLDNREMEFRIIRPDGVERWLRVKTFPIRDAQGVAYRIAGITQDITERQQSERLNSLLSAIVESSQDAIIGFTAAGKIFSWNTAAERLFGYTASEALGQDAGFVLPSENRKVALLVADTLSGGEPTANFETAFTNRKGEHLQLSLSISPIRGKSGKISGASTIIRDITWLKKSEERLREQSILLDNAQDAISLRDLQGRILYWNKGAERIYGWKAQEVIGKTTRSLLYKEENRHTYDAASVEFLKHGKWSGELLHCTRDGRDLIIACRWVLVRNGEGQPQSILVVNTDITAKKNLEEKFIDKRRVESIGALAAGIAHDLNDVLYPITLAIESLKQKLQDEEGQYLLALLKLNAERGVSLIDQVLSFARGKERERTTISLPELIHETVEVLKFTATDAVTIEVKLSDDLWTVAGDETQLKQVLINLCVNAMDAMPEGGLLTIEAQNLDPTTLYPEEVKAGRYVHVTVTDTGTGIPKEVLENIFNPFFTTKGPDKGTGLGLSTTLNIIESYGGYIEISSQVGSGTSVEVYLPAGD